MQPPGLAAGHPAFLYNAAVRKLIAALALLLGVVFILNHYTQIESVLSVVRRADWRFLSLAMLAEIGWMVFTAATFWAVFHSLGVERRFVPLIRLSAAANFANVIAPAGGMSGLALIIADARRRKQSSAHATVAGALFVLAEYAGLTVYLVLGLFALFRRGSLNAAELIPTGFLFLTTILLASVIVLGMRSAEALSDALKGAARRINRLLEPFLHRPYLSEERAESFAQETAAGLSQLKEQPGKLLPAVLFSFFSKALMLLILWLMFIAFDVPLSPGTLFGSFAIAYLFTIVSPTPAGIGVVEGLLTLTLVSMFIPLNQAAAVVLGYRAITFWLRILVGMLAFQAVSLAPATEAPSA
jgi:hypothetical protein